MRSILLTLACLQLAACAVEPVAGARVEAEAETDEMVCTREYRTGSNFAVTTCRTRSEREDQRREGQDALAKRQTRPSIGGISRVGPGGW